MPHTKSAWKRLRSSEKRRKRNRATVKGVKKQQKEFADALKAGDAAKVAQTMVDVQQKLDKAAARGVIHRNKAARLKSRMAKKVAALKSKQATTKA
jgi:small subunit ribosomal protein S20